jgi:hypothetical protein
LADAIHIPAKQVNTFLEAHRHQTTQVIAGAIVVKPKISETHWPSAIRAP